MSQQTLPCTHPPPPPEPLRVGPFFRIGVVSSVPKKCLQKKPVFFGVIQVKRLKNLFFHYIHSNQILINLK